jgi:cytochrome c-type biogenesis protein CcmH/NrfG
MHDNRSVMTSPLRLACVFFVTGALAWGQLSRGGRTRMDEQDLGGNNNIAALSTPDTSQPAFVSGGVKMADGQAVPKETRVSMFCGGFPRASDFVSPKGEFDIDLEGGSQSVTDATRASASASGLPERNALGMVNLSGCVVRAELPGYDSTEIALAMHSTLDNPDVGDILLTRQAGLTGETISATSLEAPKKAAKSYEKALEESQKKEPKLDKIAETLEDAVREYPKYAAAWNMLGDVRMQLGLNDQALAAYENSVAADPQYILPYPGLVRLVAGTGDMERTASLGRKALELNPNLDDVRFFLCAAQLRAGQNENAIMTANEIIARGADRRYPQAHQLLGAAFANTGQYQAAATSFRKFLEADPNATAAERIKAQLAEWEQLGVVKPAAN